MGIKLEAIQQPDFSSIQSQVARSSLLLTNNESISYGMYEKLKVALEELFELFSYAEPNLYWQSYVKELYRSSNTPLHNTREVTTLSTNFLETLANPLIQSDKQKEFMQEFYQFLLETTIPDLRELSDRNCILFVFGGGALSRGKTIAEFTQRNPEAAKTIIISGNGYKDVPEKESEPKEIVKEFRNHETSIRYPIDRVMLEEKSISTVHNVVNGVPLIVEALLKNPDVKTVAFSYLPWSNYRKEALFQNQGTLRYLQELGIRVTRYNVRTEKDKNNWNSFGRADIGKSIVTIREVLNECAGSALAYFYIQQLQNGLKPEEIFAGNKDATY